MQNYFLLNVLITENFYQFSYCSWNTLSLIEVLVEYLCQFFITYETLLSVILLFAEDYIPYIIYITHYITH